MTGNVNSIAQKRIHIAYQPRELQSEIHAALFNNGDRIRFACLAIHRRFGKSVFAINELIGGALTCPRKNPRFFYVAPTFKQAKSIAWDYLKDFTRPIPGMKYFETDLRADFPNGARIVLSGAENFESLRGNYVDGVVLDEWGNMSPLVYREVLRPALSDRMGWIIFLGTPNGKNHFYDTYKEALEDEEWLGRTYSVEQTKLIDEKELARSRKTMGEEEYRQEFLCDWNAAVRGSYYGLEMDAVKASGRILNISHAPTLPVDLAFDLGMDDATAVWFVQCVHNEIRLINYVEWRNTSLQEIVVELSRFPYRYGNCFLPHDASVRELTTGTTRVEVISDSDLFEFVQVTPLQKVADGINAVRQMLPACCFDSIRCDKGIDALENYRKKIDKNTKEYLEAPVHDKYSHGADAFRYLAINYHPQLGDVMERSTMAKLRTDNVIHMPKRVGVKRTGMRRA